LSNAASLLAKMAFYLLSQQAALLSDFTDSFKNSEKSATIFKAL